LQPSLSCAPGSGAEQDSTQRSRGMRGGRRGAWRVAREKESPQRPKRCLDLSVTSAPPWQIVLALFVLAMRAKGRFTPRSWRNLCDLCVKNARARAAPANCMTSHCQRTIGAESACEFRRCEGARSGNTKDLWRANGERNKARPARETFLRLSPARHASDETPVEVGLPVDFDRAKYSPVSVLYFKGEL